MKKILIFCSNIHQGGAVQVSVSVIFQLATFSNSHYAFTVFCSNKVYQNLLEVAPEVGSRIRIHVADCGPFPSPSLLRDMRTFIPDFTYVIFGPVFLPLLPGYSVCGFAQPVLLYPEVARSFVPKYLRPWLTLKYGLMKWVFRRFRCLIVEHQYLTELVARRLDFDGQTFVIPNRINEVFLNAASFQEQITRGQTLSLGYIARDYPHKNTQFLLPLRKILMESYGLKVDIYVTLTENEWNAKSQDFRQEIINVGELSIQQCPAFYQKMDAMIFPSLLECFSAAPIEALFMKKPLFASNRPFITGLLEDRAIVFDPFDPESAADRIAEFFKGKMAIDLQANHDFVTRVYCEGPSRAELLNRLIETSLAPERSST
jgi:glycosyltransferase involved in cell wall biosynthesis